MGPPRRASARNAANNCRLQPLVGNRATTSLLQRATVFHQLLGNTIERGRSIERLAAAMGIQDGDAPDQVFAQLCDYGRGNFDYHSSIRPLGTAIDDRMFNCESISDLFIHLCLLSSPAGHEVRMRSVATQPMLYRGPLGRGAFGNQASNIRGTGDRLLNALVYTATHTMAEVAGQLYDATTGVTGGRNSDYIDGTRQNGDYVFDVDGRAVRLRPDLQAPPIGGLTQLVIQ